MQIDPKKYKGIGNGFAVTFREGGIPGLVRGWAPTAIGYSVQGAGKFGLYEFFKKCVSAAALTTRLCSCSSVLLATELWLTSLSS